MYTNRVFGTAIRVLFIEVSLFQDVMNKRFHCRMIDKYIFCMLVSSEPPVIRFCFRGPVSCTCWNNVLVLVTGKMNMTGEDLRLKWGELPHMCIYIQCTLYTEITKSGYPEMRAPQHTFHYWSVYVCYKKISGHLTIKDTFTCINVPL